MTGKKVKCRLRLDLDIAEDIEDAKVTNSSKKESIIAIDVPL